MTPTDTSPAAPPAWRPASATERQFWFAERIASGSPAWRVLSTVRLEGVTDRTTLVAAAARVVARHPALRSVFTPAAGQLRCTTVAPAEPPLLMLPPGADFAAAAREMAASDLLDPAAGHHVVLGLSEDPDGGAASTLYVLTHHLVYDGLSHEVFTADLARAYARVVAGEPEPAPLALTPAPRPARPAEFTAYWKEALDGAPDLPGADDGPTQRELARATPRFHAVPFPDGVGDATREAARRLACPPFAVLLTAYAQALYDLCGAEDFCIGTPVSTRTPDLADAIGCLLTTLPVRIRRPAEPDACERVWKTFTDGLVHMDLPQDDVLRAARTRPGRRLPLYQALFAYESWQRPEHLAGPLRMRSEPVTPLGVQAEIQFQLNELPGQRLEGLLQAPEGGIWAARLERLSDAVRDRLTLLTGAGGRPNDPGPPRSVSLTNSEENFR
ncbi:Linear gramicidin synthase subunit B [Streptomyces hundungensis]|uniref:Linear gramicidin synthase subunit B n=1 Tax=Streptomyces hundungensis TaxID=1077946 RepID=A0A387HA36_9ACTN|nr:condensation domain-containing protein [Streptomyces hundungensis]AYG79093.1 Linear gramicidin synthase subunit B [Streptomyces hundungensis]